MSASEALEGAPDEAPDVLLLDLRMPEVDGIELMKKFREKVGYENVPVIFLTAIVEESQINELKALGAIGVISKPFDPTNLTAQIEEILNKN
jgi:CheY-like chemotaxis protein